MPNSKNLANYFTEVSPSSAASETLMIDISDLHEHFLIDLDSKSKDKAIDFDTLKKDLKDKHGIEILNQTPIKIHPDCFENIIKDIRTHRANCETFNNHFNFILVAHGGPAWFFGPIQNYLREKIGMVWLETDDVPQHPFFHHSHFVLTPSQVYFFPKGQIQAINCGLDLETIQNIIKYFNPENLKSYYYRSENLCKVSALSREELLRICDWICFDIELNDTDEIAWIESEHFEKSVSALIDKKHFIMTKKQLFFFDGEQYFEAKKANIIQLKQLFPKTKLPKLKLGQHTYLGYQTVAKPNVRLIKQQLGQTGITWNKTEFRQKDFIQDERNGAKFIFEELDLMMKRTGIQIDNILLHSCFSASEFLNEETGNYMFSCARMFSTLFKNTNVIGCVGLNADIKVSQLYLQDNINANIHLPPTGYNLTDGLVTYRQGRCIKETPQKFALKSESSYLKNLTAALFNNKKPSFFFLHNLDDLYSNFSETDLESFGTQQAKAYPKPKKNEPNEACYNTVFKI